MSQESSKLESMDTSTDFDNYPSFYKERDGTNDNDIESVDSVGSNADESSEPDTDKTDRISYALICGRMEQLWKLRSIKRRRKINAQQKFDLILPKKILEATRMQSLYPLIRLYAPDNDNARTYQMKDRLIAQSYCSVLGFSKGTKKYDMLYHFTDPAKCPPHLNGDLSLVVEHIMRERTADTPSKLNIGEVNKLLDELHSLGNRHHHHNHTFRETKSPNKGERSKTVAKSRGKWLKKVVEKGLSPVEHKWLVRIILKKPEYGFGYTSLLKHLSPYAMELWSAHTSLKSLCDTLAYPQYERSRQQEEENEKQFEKGTATRWEPQKEKVAIGNIFAPMMSGKLYFEKAMSVISTNHTIYLKTSPEKACLALRFPAICAEVKLDGERMLAHVLDGKVTIQTRNRNWYSDLYSPVLGAPIRRALSNHRVNVILDGEVMAWDNVRKDLVPFGSNRTIANYRRAYLRSKGLLGDLDKNFHSREDSKDGNVKREAEDSIYIKTNGSNSNDGKDCWLLYSVFDILYVDGPDANKLLQTECGFDDVSPGSIIHLPCLQRKQVLYRLLEEQDKEVEICKSIVIRPNGKCVSGEKYFRTTEPIMEYGHLATQLDSTQTVIQGSISNLEEIDNQRRGACSMTEISQQRAQAVEDFYQRVVEYHRKEGIVVKDLASPYILGETSRARKFWHKFKPDYEKGNAVDFDVVILGGYYATGLKYAGKITHFLCGCLDSESAEYMTFCNVNGRSVNDDRLHKILEHTGFKKGNNNEPIDLGKWIPSEEIEGGADLPEWISDRSLQRNGGREDYLGWSFTRNKNYPDLWIRPKDSAVITIEGQELVLSEDYSLGISLRFAKIAKVRLDSVDGDEKATTEVEDERSLWEYYQRNMQQREQTAAVIDSSTLSPSKLTGKTQSMPRRFLTPEEFQRNSRKRRRSSKPLPTSKVPKIPTETSALSRIAFVVLDGRFSLDPESLDAQQAKEEGWLEEALQIKEKEDCMHFILKHGGKVKVAADIGDKFVLGGHESDPRVICHMKAIENAKTIVTTSSIWTSRSKKSAENLQIAESPGVLKWSFVFSLVYRWKAAQRDISAEEESRLPPIKDGDLKLLEPKTHHFLVRNITEEERTGEDIFAIDRVESLTATEFERSIEEIGDRNTDKIAKIPWQNRQYWLGQVGDDSFARQRFDQIFWSCSWGSSKVDQVVIYPHIFRNEFGLQNIDSIRDLTLQSSVEWHEWQNRGLTEESCEGILSTVPLATCMGAIVTRNLNKQVTHVICHLKEGVHALTYSPGAPQMKRNFVDVEKGLSLLNYLKSFETHQSLLFVSPNWIRQQWDIYLEADNGT